MATIVEDGSIVTGANSYVSEAELSAYATARAYTLVSTAAVLLVKSMDYIENQLFIGTKYSADQPLSWPRDYVYIDGYLFDNDAIPSQLKNAQMAAALAIDSGNSPLAAVDRQTQKERVGELEVVYKNSSVSNPIDPTINMYLRPLLAGGSGNNFRVNKG